MNKIMNKISLEIVVGLTILSITHGAVAGAVEVEQYLGIDNSPLCVVRGDEYITAKWYLDGQIVQVNDSSKKIHCIEIKWEKYGSYNLTAEVNNGWAAPLIYNVSVKEPFLQIRPIRANMSSGFGLGSSENFTGRWYLDNLSVQENLTVAKEHSYNKTWWDVQEIGDHYLLFSGERDSYPGISLKYGWKIFVGTFFLTNETVSVVNATVKSLLLAPGDVANLTTIVDVETVDSPVQLIHGMTRTSQKLLNLSKYQVSNNWTGVNSTREIQQSGGRNVTVINMTLFGGNNNGTFYVDLIGPIGVEYTHGSYENGTRRIPVNRTMAEIKFSWLFDPNGNFWTKDSAELAYARQLALVNNGTGTNVSDCPNIVCIREDNDRNGKVDLNDYNRLRAKASAPVPVVS